MEVLVQAPTVSLHDYVPGKAMDDCSTDGAPAILVGIPDRVPGTCLLPGPVLDTATVQGMS